MFKQIIAYHHGAHVSDAVHSQCTTEPEHDGLRTVDALDSPSSLPGNRSPTTAGGPVPPEPLSRQASEIGGPSIPALLFFSSNPTRPEHRWLNKASDILSSLPMQSLSDKAASDDAIRLMEKLRTMLLSALKTSDPKNRDKLKNYFSIVHFLLSAQCESEFAHFELHEHERVANGLAHVLATLISALGEYVSHNDGSWGNRTRLVIDVVNASLSDWEVPLATHGSPIALGGPIMERLLTRYMTSTLNLSFINQMIGIMGLEACVHRLGLTTGNRQHNLDTTVAFATTLTRALMALPIA